MSILKEALTRFSLCIQFSLFPQLKEELGELNEKHQKVVHIFELIRLEDHIPGRYWQEGRPRKDRVALARCFVAKIFYNLATTRMLFDRLQCDIVLRRLCGYERQMDIPSESTFSRAFDEFSKTQLPARVHEALIRESHEDRLVGHVSRDSTAILGREKPKRKEALPIEDTPQKKKRGRPRKGEEKKPEEPTRLQKQPHMTLEEMVNDLPKACDVGCKKNSQGYKETWIGYKLHIDTVDGDIPVNALLTSASLHDSQVAIPLATQTATRCQSCYDLMDSAYDAVEIHTYCHDLGHVAIIDTNPRRDKTLAQELKQESKCQQLLNIQYPQDTRYHERTAAERVNSRLKDEFGGNSVRVKGHAKVFCHLMFGILVLAADQLLRLAAI